MMGSLFDLIGLITPGHSAWHDGFKFAARCDPDGSWWTVDASFGWKFPVRDASEALEVFGSFTSADPGWILR